MLYRSWLLLLCLVTITGVRPALACLWDRDTLQAEAQGLPETLDVIVGKFDRNPALFYELRLQRVEAEILKDPANLALYDDAAVACDRLGRSEDAIRWMEAKLSRLKQLPPQTPEAREHRYRYLANVGTFWAHRWLREGANRDQLGSLQKACDYIREAIRLNPDAHFGREKYQLQALEWMLNPPSPPSDTTQWTLLPTFLSTPGQTAPGQPPKTLQSTNWPEAVEGISGLIVLGNAWESVDVYNALAAALLRSSHNSLAYLARLRAAELVQNGGKSLHPQAPTGSALHEWLRTQRYMLQENQLREVERQFHQLRQHADLVHQVREDYLLERLRAGRHPDTDPDFWNDYREPALPTQTNIPSVSLAVMGGLLGSVMACWLFRRRLKLQREQTRAC